MTEDIFIKILRTHILQALQEWMLRLRKLLYGIHSTNPSFIMVDFENIFEFLLFDF